MNTRRKFIRNTALGLVALSAGNFIVESNKQYFNVAQLFAGGVRFCDVEKLLINDFPELYKDVVLIKVKCNLQENKHSIAELEFLEKVSYLNTKYNDLKINTLISDKFDVAHYNYQQYLEQLHAELKNLSEFINKNKSYKKQKVNLLVTSDIGRNNYFNDLNEIGELSGLDHDGEGANETFALFYSNSKKLTSDIFSNKIVLQENVFPCFENMIFKSEKDIFALMA